MNELDAYPWPKGYGPIEAISSATPNGVDMCRIHGRKAMAPLKRLTHRHAPTGQARIHGRKAMAPLKHRGCLAPACEEVWYPWPKGYGPIEALILFS